MRFLFISFMFLIVVSGLFAGGTTTQSEARSSSHSRHSVGGILGELGKPLGQVLCVEGWIVDGNTPLSPKAAMLRFFLKADSVSGVKLEHPVMVVIRKEDNVRLTPGTHVTLIGWETGRCDGILNDPDHLLKGGGMTVAAPAFGFHSEFVVGEILR